MKQTVLLFAFILGSGWGLLLQAQSPELSRSQAPVKTYPAAGIKAPDSVIVSQQMQQMAASELRIADSLLQHFTVKDSTLLSTLAARILLGHFILGHWQEVVATARRYQSSITVLPAFKGAPFPELVAYAMTAESGLSESSYTDALDRWVQGAVPENRKTLVDYLDDRTKYGRSYFTIYQYRAADSLSSTDLDMYLWIYAGCRLPARVREWTLRYAAQYEAQEYMVNENVRIPLPDGTHLRGMVIYSRAAGRPLPVILRVNCYPVENSTEKWKLRAWADSGYAGVTVYPRGKGGSEGAFHPFENDAKDNYAVIDWISQQPWCNGKVGMYGGSYLGFTQWAAVKKVHPALKTIVPQVAVGIGLDYPNPNGVFMPYMLQWIKYVRNGVFADNLSFSDYRKWDSLDRRYILQGIPFNRLDSMESRPDTIFQRWLQHPAWDRYWQQMTPTPEEFARINIPILTTTGFFDDDQRGAMHYYNTHQQYGRPDVVKNHYLLIGPYDHGGGQGGRIKPYMAPYRIDSAAMISLPQIVAQWFNYTLKGGPKPAFLQDRISVFTLGENRWHYFPDTKRMNTDTLRYALSGQRNAADSSWQLLEGRQAAVPGSVPLSFYTANTIDTMDIFSVADGNTVEKVFRRKDFIQFLSPPLAKDANLNGTFLADLWLSLSAPDADIQLGLWEVDVQGKRWPLSFTFQRLSHSQDITRRQPWVKGKIYHVIFKEAHWISKQLKQGSRLLLVVSPLSGLSFEKNYGGIQPVSGQGARDARPVELMLHTGPRYPSQLLVPVM